MEQHLIYQAVSSNGRFSLEVSRLDETTAYFLAIFRCIDGSAGLGELNAWFGPYGAAPPGELVIRWDLPDHVCGIYLGSCCYGLFRYGAGRRRIRGSFRVRLDPPFTEEEIAWFCAKTHDQYRSRTKQVSP